MEEYNFKEVQSCYDLVAKEYSEQFENELDGKLLDRTLLDRFVAGLDREGSILDLATGSGHIANYLYRKGVVNVKGTDISEKSLAFAGHKYPHIKFEYGNLLDTGLPDESVDGIICFYGIVHFTYTEIGLALSEWHRILKPGGKALFSFHIGNDDSIRVEAFLNKENAKATWNNFKVETIIDLLQKYNIGYDDVIIRYPYVGKEHPSKRCYIEFSKNRL